MTASPPRSPRGFELLIALFPREFRHAFGNEMRGVFADQLIAARAAGLPAVVHLWIRTSTRMIAAAWRERRTSRAPRASTFASGLVGGLIGALAWLRSDLQLAGRLLIKRPGFAAAVIAAIAIGVGAVATIFSAVNAIVLRPLPGVRDGGRLVGVDRRSPDMSEGASASYLLFAQIRDRSQTLDDAAVWSRVALSITAEGRDGAAVAGAIVSRNYFDVLGVRAARGRFFLPGDGDETRPAAVAEIVVGHDFWRRQLGGDEAAIGRTVLVNGARYRLIGVAAPDFRGVFTPLKIEAWVPLSAQPHVRPGRDLAHAPWFWLFGRLRDGIDREAVGTELTQMMAAWAATAPESAAIRAYSAARITPLTGLPDDANRALTSFSAVLMGAAILVLLVAAANVSSLLAARAVSRRRELSLRAALGAGRGRLIRQLLTETLALFALGGIGGVLVAWAGTSALERLPLPGDTALTLEISPDIRVVLFSLLIALMAGALVGIGPALSGASRRPSALLRDGSSGATRRSFTANALIVAQLASSIVLLAAAGLFVRALDRGWSTDPGFDTTNVLTLRLNTESYGYGDAQSAAFFSTLRTRVLDRPTVAAAAFATVIPLTETPSNATLVVRGDGAGEVQEWRVSTAAVGAGYFDTLRMPLLAGRDFNDSDVRERPTVAVISRALEERAWPGQSAVGRTLTMGDRQSISQSTSQSVNRSITVIGVARDAMHVSLDETPKPFVYLPISVRRQSALTLLVRARGDAAGLARGLGDEVRAMDPALPRPLVTALADETGVAVLPQRVAALITGVLGMGGLALAAIGLYGSLAYAVSLRMRELGVRRALGARERDVVSLIARQGLRLAGAGLVLGLAVAALATPALGSYLLGVSPLDAFALVGAAALFMAVALAASVIPARRAALADPIDALRGRAE